MNPLTERRGEQSHCTSTSTGASWGGSAIFSAFWVNSWGLFWVGPWGSSVVHHLSFLAKNYKPVTRNQTEGTRLRGIGCAEMFGLTPCCSNSVPWELIYTSVWSSHATKRGERTWERLNWSAAKVSCLDTSVWIWQIFHQTVNSRLQSQFHQSVCFIQSSSSLLSQGLAVFQPLAFRSGETPPSFPPVISLLTPRSGSQGWRWRRVSRWTRRQFITGPHAPGSPVDN